MKKLILFAAALVCATAVNAATLVWGTSWVYSTDYDNGTAAGGAWLVYLGGSDGLGGISVNNAGVLSFGNNTQLGVMAGVSGGTLVGNTPLDLAAATWNGRSLVMVAYDSGTKFYGISDVWIVGGLADGTSLPNPLPPNQITHIFGTGGEELFLNIPAVPEPTSLALLALGVAAIGLRRRIRKA